MDAEEYFFGPRRSIDQFPGSTLLSARITGISVTFADEGLKKLLSKGVTGIYAPEQALTKCFLRSTACRLSVQLRGFCRTNLQPVATVATSGPDAGVADRDIAHTRRFGVAPSLAFGLGTTTRLTLSYLHLQSDDNPDYGIPWLFNGPAPVGSQQLLWF